MKNLVTFDQHLAEHLTFTR